jgi:regulator of cell morphogenesis and NO signaling
MDQQRLRGGATGAVTADEAPVEQWELHRLADHIVAAHHEYVRGAVPVLRELTAKVARVHGAGHPELAQVRDLVWELATELEHQMAAEEESVFPRIAHLSWARGRLSRGSLGVSVVPLEDEHVRATALMDRIRSLSDGFTAPADACMSYRAMYEKLAEFEADLQRHVHLEDEVLFPRARAAEADLWGSESAP